MGKQIEDLYQYNLGEIKKRRRISYLLDKRETRDKFNTLSEEEKQKVFKNVQDNNPDAIKKYFEISQLEDLPLGKLKYIAKALNITNLHLHPGWELILLIKEKITDEEIGYDSLYKKIFGDQGEDA